MTNCQKIHWRPANEEECIINKFSILFMYVKYYFNNYNFQQRTISQIPMTGSISVDEKLSKTKYDSIWEIFNN